MNQMSSEKKVIFAVKKNEDFHEWYNQILYTAEITDKRYPVKGEHILRPYGFFIHNRIMSIISEEWEKQGVEQALFPLLIPEKFLALEGEHVAGFSSEVYWVTHGGDKQFEERRALRPTSETAIYYMFSQWIRSFRDLPLKVHQTCNVFRYETQQTRPLIRPREIHWNEAHTAHATKEEALENLENAWRSYMYLINDCCCFYGLRLRRPAWDKFPGSEHTDVMDTIMPCGKVLQTVGAHYLGQKFSKVFDIKFLTSNNTTDLAHITCYGISTRILAALLSLHGDDYGLILPPILAKYQVVIVPILPIHNSHAQTISQLLQSVGIRTVVDNSQSSIGEKYYYWEMKGVPLRIEVGSRDIEQNRVTVCIRDTRSKVYLHNADLIPGIQHHLEELTIRIRNKAKMYHESSIHNCKNIDEIKSAIEKGGFAKFPFCSTVPALAEATVGEEAVAEADIGEAAIGEEADKIIHELTGGEIRGSSPFDPPPPDGSICAVTGRLATVYAYAARAY